MELTTTIRSELEQFIKNNNLTITQFAERSDMNCGTISNIIRGQRPIAMQQLDKITVGMGLPPGSFYENYAKECFVHDTPNWRRLRPFIHKCAELNLLLPLELAINGVMDNLTYIPLLFDTAEQLFNEGKKEAAAIIYSCVAESEKYQHSERLALCQYRLFTIKIGDDQDNNLRIAFQFEPFVERLDEIDQIDALKDLANLYSSLRKWNKVEQLAIELNRKAMIQYNLKHQQCRKDRIFKEPSKPLYGCILYSQLLQAGVSEQRGDYVKALYHTSLYADTSWIIEKDIEAERTKEQFATWATANTYLYQLMTGNVDVLDKYLAFNTNHEQELFTALFMTVRAANQYNFNIDEILQQYEDYIFQSIHFSRNTGTYTSQIIDDRFAHFLADLSIYYLNKSMIDNGLKNLINSLAYAIKLYNEPCIIRCMTLFEKYRSIASDNLINEYQKLISEVQKLNEEKTCLINVRP